MKARYDQMFQKADSNNDGLVAGLFPSGQNNRKSSL